MATRKLEQIDKQIAQLKARRQLALNRQRRAERRLDTRRKIILGGTVIAMVRDGDQTAADVLRRALARMADRDRVLMADWETTT